MVKTATRTVDLAPIDRLEDKVKALVALVERLKGDAARLAEDNARLAREVEGLHTRLTDAETAFRDDMKKFPDNGWSLSGLRTSLYVSSLTTLFDPRAPDPTEDSPVIAGIATVLMTKAADVLPFGVVIDSGPEVAPPGTVTTSLLAVADTTVAAVPLKVTVF